MGRTDFLLALQTQLDGLVINPEEWVDDDAEWLRIPRTSPD